MTKAMILRCQRSSGFFIGKRNNTPLPTAIIRLKRIAKSKEVKNDNHMELRAFAKLRLTTKPLLRMENER